MKKQQLILVMGVSGVGKTRIGKQLAQALDLPFFDADDYHPAENLTKMKQGHPLTDIDRQPWLNQLNVLLQEQNNQGIGAVLACSALKESYRQILRNNLDDAIKIVYLKGSFTLIEQRMKSREGHFMPSQLLASQFTTLEPPTEAMETDVSATPINIINELLKQLK